MTSRSSILKGGDSGPAAVVGNPGESLLIQAVRYEHEPKMPPKERLKDRQIDVLSRWVAQSLPWPEPGNAKELQSAAAGTAASTDAKKQFWAFQPVKDSPPPSVRDSRWPKGPIDRYILSTLENKGLSTAAPADKRTLLRRATFDLIGLPPTPAEIDAFLADNSPLAFSRVIDRLLATPQYGERWGRHWLDVVRYADARDLIQLPPESDFREAWRYRDWVVESFNRDLPYPDFVRSQVAGDLLPPKTPVGINKDGLIATGMLAIADFVPGDVDKDQMIADYVNDQVDVVSRAFLGLSIACARCHDHKFDPISTEDYYSLAGIFFSTRLIPGPVAGNTPLVRVPLLPLDELTKIQVAEDAAKARRSELEQELPEAIDRAYATVMRRLLKEETSRYLVAASEYRQKATQSSLAKIAERHRIHKTILKGFSEYLGRVSEQRTTAPQSDIRAIASGKLSGQSLEVASAKLQESLASFAARRDAKRSPKERALASSCLIQMRADDPAIVTNAEGQVIVWPSRANLPGDARQVQSVRGPKKATTSIKGRSHSIVRFDGESLLEVARRVPTNGSLFLVFRAQDTAGAGRRIVGWEDSDAGKHGLGIMLESGGGLHAILRNNGQLGDLVHQQKGTDFEVVGLTWGPNGTTFHRDGKLVGSQKGFVGVSADPNISALCLGGPGSGGGLRFRGDIAEFRVYNRQLNESERALVEREMFVSRLDPHGLEPAPCDPVAELYDEMVSARGPFWLSAVERSSLLPIEARSRIDALNRELEVLKTRPPVEVPRAVVVQDGGPKGTRHEGFKDAQVFIRGNSKRLGKTVPRGIPRVFVGDQAPQLTIGNGSGRRELADWLTRSDNPLAARVMVNRIWQRHFGEGLVRTPNDFGERGERPTHPALLDHLAARFVESGWSVKAMHRMIMLSSTYQQSSRASSDVLAIDPENRFLGRVNRRRLDAESIRDALLSVTGRLKTTLGGAAFADLALPRRTLYLQSVRTGPSASDFGRLFDRADPGSMVAQRGESVVAPQSLFFLNDPFVGEQARSLATRVVAEVNSGQVDQIRKLYVLTLGRPPTTAESSFAIRFLAAEGGTWERYCQLILCQNEFIYIE